MFHLRDKLPRPPFAYYKSRPVQLPGRQRTEESGIYQAGVIRGHRECHVTGRRAQVEMKKAEPVLTSGPASFLTSDYKTKTLVKYNRLV
jgi:hypothetical protein